MNISEASYAIGTPGAMESGEGNRVAEGTLVITCSGRVAGSADFSLTIQVLRRCEWKRLCMANLLASSESDSRRGYHSTGSMVPAVCEVDMPIDNTFDPHI